MDRHPSRRQFVLSGGMAGLALLAGCGRLPWQAQPPAKVPRLGYLSSISSTTTLDRLREALHELGYVDGQNLVIDYRSSEGRDELLPALAAELVALQVDIIVTQRTTATVAAGNATATIPIVQAEGGSDLARAGIVASVARPGGNITGLTEIAPELSGKRLELLKETVAGLARVAVLWYPPNPRVATQLEETQEAAQALGIHLHALAVRGPDDFESLVEAAMRERADALLLLTFPLTVAHYPQIAAIALAQRLPAMFDRRGFASVGGLMAYGPNVASMHRRAAYYVDRILKGTKPADLPVEQPMTFDFVVNMKTARELGITFPHEVTLQITEVIEG